MDVEDAVTVYLYMHQQSHVRTAEERFVYDLAWKTICRDAQALIKQYGALAVRQGEPR